MHLLSEDLVCQLNMLLFLNDLSFQRQLFVVLHKMRASKTRGINWLPI